MCELGLLGESIKHGVFVTRKEVEAARGVSEGHGLVGRADVEGCYGRTIGVDLVHHHRPRGHSALLQEAKLARLRKTGVNVLKV